VTHSDGSSCIKDTVNLKEIDLMLKSSKKDRPIVLWTDTVRNNRVHLVVYMFYSLLRC
jgi:hypothetical protein